MRIALYARVSTGRQAEKEISIPDQFFQMRNWCQKIGYEVVKEFQEKGASATTDDRRPMFQQMMRDAKRDKPLFDAIVVHSLSRFYRDQIELCMHERQLKRHGIQLISITQLTADDYSGEMTRRMISMFDEFSSKENAKHTLRAMKENARQGYHNGSRPPYGYSLEIITYEGRKDVKKRLIIDEIEAQVVREMFTMYLERSEGVKGIAGHYNGREILRRGNRWSSQTIHHVLTNATYTGEQIFNKSCWKTGIEKPEEEWVRIAVPQIISEDLFELVQRKLHSRNREISHPRRISSPRLLTGVLKCGVCGGNMVLATGKNNTYRYYKCSNRIRKDLDMCDSKPVTMEMLDKFVLNALINQVLTLDRVAAMLVELKRRMKQGSGTADMKSLVKQLEAIKARISNMYDAIEKGAVSIDDILKERIEALRTQKSDVERKISNYSNSPQAVMDTIDIALVKTFCEEARKKLNDSTSKFAKEYLQLLVSEIIVTGDEVKIKGNYGILVGAVKFAAKKKNLSTSEEVLRFNQDWRPRADDYDNWEIYHDFSRLFQNSRTYN